MCLCCYSLFGCAFVWASNSSSRSRILHISTSPFMPFCANCSYSRLAWEMPIFIQHRRQNTIDDFKQVENPFGIKTTHHKAVPSGRSCQCTGRRREGSQHCLSDTCLRNHKGSQAVSWELEDKKQQHEAPQTSHVTTFAGILERICTTSTRIQVRMDGSTTQNLKASPVCLHLHFSCHMAQHNVCSRI